MTNQNWDKQEETLLADYLVRRLHDKARGRSDDECLRNYPRDVYFVGNLRPRRDQNPGEEAQPGHLRELLSKIAPMAFGAEFALSPSTGSVFVDVEVHVDIGLQRVFHLVLDINFADRLFLGR